MKDDAKRKKEIADWLNSLHLYFINNVEHKGASQSKFSLWLELPENTVSRAMRGVSMPSLETMIAFAKRGGPKIYDICGVPRLMPDDTGIHEFVDLYYEMPPEERDVLLESVLEVMRKKQSTPNKI